MVESDQKYSLDLGSNNEVIEKPVQQEAQAILENIKDELNSMPENAASGFLHTYEALQKFGNFRNLEDIANRVNKGDEYRAILESNNEVLLKMDFLYNELHSDFEPTPMHDKQVHEAVEDYKKFISQLEELFG